MLDPKMMYGLRQRVSDASLLESIVELDAVAAALPFVQFREPVAVGERNDKGNHRLINLDATYLIAWCNHIVYSIRVRLRALEPGILAALVAGQALSAQILLRSHLEAAAMASLCLETLMSRDWDALSVLVPQTLFGTALIVRAKHDERVAEMLTYAEQRTITITRAIAALHRFAYPEGGEDNSSISYSLLCDASHPNHRGTQHFIVGEDVDDTGEYGWYISYSNEESVPADLIECLLDLLLHSMRCGYAATELLRGMTLSDSDGTVVVRGVPIEVGREIWLRFMQKPVKD